MTVDGVMVTKQCIKKPKDNVILNGGHYIVRILCLDLHLMPFKSILFQVLMSFEMCEYLCFLFVQLINDS